MKQKPLLMKGSGSGHGSDTEGRSMTQRWSSQSRSFRRPAQARMARALLSRLSQDSKSPCELLCCARESQARPRCSIVTIVRLDASIKDSTELKRGVQRGIQRGRALLASETGDGSKAERRDGVTVRSCAFTSFQRLRSIFRYASW